FVLRRRASYNVGMIRSRSTLALWLGAAGLWALFLGFLGLHLVTPSDGARLPPGASRSAEPGWLLQPLRPGSLRAGDRLLAVDGRSLAALAEELGGWPLDGPRYAFGQTVRYTIERAGSVQTV